MAARCPLGNADFATNGVFQPWRKKKVMGFSISAITQKAGEQSVNTCQTTRMPLGIATQVKEGTFKPTPAIMSSV